MNSALRRLLVAGAALAVLAPMTAFPARDTGALEAALRAHITTLASDAFSGRAPGTEGETRTLRYLAKQWFELGLVSGTNDPANPWFAPVELVRRIPHRSSARFVRAGRAVPIAPDEIVIITDAPRALVRDAPVIFVGHALGPQKPELLAGRIALMLDSLPPGAKAELAGTRQAKLHEAGAAAVVTVLDGSRTLDDVRAQSRAMYSLASTEREGRVEVYLAPDAAARLVVKDFPALLAQAAIAPVRLPVAGSLEADNREEPLTSHNLIGRLPGRGSSEGAVLLLAHWDHLGVCAAATSADRICNGAIDNASGVAVLTEIARSLARGRPLARDVYFLATTAEEFGLLGAHAFAEDPPLPLDRVVAALNIDSPAMARRGRPLSIMGEGRTPLDPAIALVARRMNRQLVPSSVAEGYLKRQDGWALLQHDVPAVMVGSGYADIGFLTGFMGGTYHRPGDEATPQLDLSGAADDAVFLEALVRWLADPANYPDRRPAPEDRSSATSSRVPG